MPTATAAPQPVATRLTAEGLSTARVMQSKTTRGSGAPSYLTALKDISSGSPPRCNTTVQALLLAHLPDQDPVRAHPQRLLDQPAQRDLAGALEVSALGVVTPA